MKKIKPDIGNLVEVNEKGTQYLDAHIDPLRRPLCGIILGKRGLRVRIMFAEQSVLWFERTLVNVIQ